MNWACLSGVRESRAGPFHLVPPQRHLQPKCDGLCVDTVGSPDHQRGLVLDCLIFQRTKNALYLLI